jgi:hypothetical protein
VASELALFAVTRCKDGGFQRCETRIDPNKLIDESNSAWVDVIVRALSYDLRRKHPSKKRQKLARASVEKLLHSLTQLTEECERKGWKNKNLQYKHRIVRQLRADLGRLLKIDQSLENTKIVKRVQQTIQKIK